MLDIFLVYLGVASALTFVLYGADKLFAKTKNRRIPERTLLFASTIGGAFGGTLGMLVFRHKTRKPRFVLTNVVALILHLAVAILLINIG